MAKIKPVTEQETNLMEENFCKYYLFGFYKGKKTKNNRYRQTVFRMGNATHSYAQAFQKDLKKKGQENVCAVEGSKLLRIPKIKKRMRKMIEDSGFNDEVVDSRLTEIITVGSDKDSNVAIKTYNDLQKRIEATTIVVSVDVDKKGSLNKALEYLHGKSRR